MGLTGSPVGVRHGVAELDDVPARLELHDGLETRGEIEVFLRREHDALRLLAVDGDAEIFLISAVLLYADGEDIVAVRVRDDVFKADAALARVQPGDILPAGERGAFHPAREPAQNGVGHLIVRRLAAAERRDLDGIDQRRIARHGDVVTEIVLEILRTPPCERARVGALSSQARGQILAGQRAVGGIETRLDAHVVELADDGGDAVREPHQVSLPLSVLVAHVGVPVVVEIDIPISRLIQPALLERAGGIHDEIVIDVVAESVPARPPHEGRCPHPVLIDGMLRSRLDLGRKKLPYITKRTHFVAFLHSLTSCCVIGGSGVSALPLSVRPRTDAIRCFLRHAVR